MQDLDLLYVARVICVCADQPKQSPWNQYTQNKHHTRTGATWDSAMALKAALLMLAALLPAVSSRDNNGCMSEEPLACACSEASKTVIQK